MCLAILKRPNATIPEHYLRLGFKNNDDGAGFVYAHNGKLITQKGFFNFDDFLAAYKTIPPEAVAAVHFRLATHGTIDERNCHPFAINEEFSIIHNGVIPNFGIDGVLSDTGHYAEAFLRPIFNMFDRKELKKLNLSDGSSDIVRALHYLIFSSSSANKIVLVRANGQYRIFGEKYNGCGWINNVWYSNGSMLEPEPEPIVEHADTNEITIEDTLPDDGEDVDATQLEADTALLEPSGTAVLNL
jgi:hypothetical protein